MRRTVELDEADLGKLAQRSLGRPRADFEMLLDIASGYLPPCRQPGHNPPMLIIEFQWR